MWSEKKHEIILLIFVAIYIGFFSLFTILRYQTFHSEQYDLGIMNQVVYNTAHGRILEMTDPEGSETVKRMVFHNDPLLALLAPFYLVHSGPETLLLIQTITLALGGLLVYKIAQLIIRSDFVALSFAIAYLLYPPMQWSNVFDFHAVTLSTTFLLAMFYFAITKRIRLSLTFLILAILSKEQVAAVTALFGLYLYKKKHKKFGLTIFFISLFWVFASFYAISFFRKGAHFALTRYENLKSPGQIVWQVIQTSSFRYVVLLFGPLLFLSLLSPIVLVTIPEFAVNLLSSSFNQRDIIHHYTAVITPFLFVAAIYGVQLLNKKKIVSEKRISWALITAALIANFYFGPLPHWRNVFPPFFKAPSESADVYRWAKNLGDENIKVASTGTLAPVFSSRKTIIRFSESYQYADFVVLLRSQAVNDWLDPTSSKKAYEQLIADPKFKLVEKKGELEVYKKL